MKRILTGLLLAALGFQLFGCGTEQQLPAQTQESTAAGTQEAVQNEAEAAAEFALDLLRKCDTAERNCILSPYSVMTALAMTANGAGGETLRQFEAVFGMPQEQVNAYLQHCTEQAGQEVAMANSIWLREEDGHEFLPEFRQTNEALFQAESRIAAFDEQTVIQINDWVSEHTKQRIDRIVESMDDASMVLLNALTFDGVWEQKYTAGDVHEGTFTAADGSTQSAEMLTGRENAYLDDGMATGFVKAYQGGKYSFAALLPNEGTDMQTYLASLTGSGLLETIRGAAEEPVRTKMPKLKTETSLSLGETLQALGLTDAFSETADFSRMCIQPQRIDEVLHKTYLQIDEEGTEAASATAVIMTRSARPDLKIHTVTLDRPYVMLILDNETGCILFLGVVNSILQ